MADESRAAVQEVPLAIAWAQALLERWRSLGTLGLSEARLAAMGVAAMMFFSAAAALLSFTAWLTLNGLFAMALMRAGLNVEIAIALIALANAAGAALCWSRALGLTRHLEFKQTRRVLGALADQHVDS